MSVVVEELLQVDPGTLVIGSNIRVDTHLDARDFAASIKSRGVVEVITAYRGDDGTLVVVRGQRRAVVAAQVGTPTGTVPVRVVPAPADVDRIVDQMTENVHRTEMAESELRDGIEQLALCGISAAQIAKRTAVRRGLVDAALAVTGNDATRTRMDSQGLTLEDAAVFAEFEDDDRAVETLTQALHWNQSLDHVAQRLRDAAAEAAVRAAEAERLRAEGLPALDPADTPENVYRLRLDSLLTADRQPIPEADWPNVPGAAVAVEQEWQYPDNGDQDADIDADDRPRPESNEVRVLKPVWICTDPAAANLYYRHDHTFATTTRADGAEGDPQTNQVDEQEVRRAERRRVIDNNKAWRSAETVRREWLATFLTRKTAPQGAEAIICKALVGAEYTLTRSMQEGHRLLGNLLGGDSTETTNSYTGMREARHRLAVQPTTAKAATMRALGCVIAAWEESTSTQTWRNPTPWDAQVIAALTNWGYRPSDVETLLLPTTAEPDQIGTPDHEVDPDQDDSAA